MSNPSPALSDQARWRRALGTVHKLCEIVSVAMFAALFLTFVAQIFWRYVLLFVTTSLFTAATQMSLRDHVGMDLALGIAPPQVRRWLLTLSLGLFALVMLASVPDTVQVLKWMYRERTYAIGFNLGHLFVLMIFFVIAYVLRAVMAILRLWRAGWQDEV
jgi:TRAP-type C4-dicarboxylate transport system permease small subunit